MLIDRIGVDLGGSLPIEKALQVAGRHGLKYIDVQLTRFKIARQAGVNVD